jgi:hypothetical protein
MAKAKLIESIEKIVVGAIADHIFDMNTEDAISIPAATVRDAPAITVPIPDSQLTPLAS